MQVPLQTDLDVSIFKLHIKNNANFLTCLTFMELKLAE